jgi:hypothetical protein
MANIFQITSHYGLDNNDANSFMALFSSDAAEQLHAHLPEQHDEMETLQ